ncbi:tRNA (guanosine(37)-N1)-methyltransferase TrmD [Sulfurimonas sp. MAG313]|nr:tRNA (guanosine(37)-N1)-methyltransferase TrmD [Sulfurimonas sp. MAG313]MDF1880586.1 tRNA (guanosine(37)-N1)-methyltransferase TrmD [Sulfurimonas sp. MAG313]
MTFSFISLFPNLISGYFEDSILSRAIEKGFLEINYVNPRDFSSDKWKKVDDTAVGGGAGMVMTPQPLFDTLTSLQEEDVHIIFASPVGKPFNQNDAKRLAKKKHIAFVSGRYEGIDERVIERFADEVYCIGDYILTGGELPSLVMADAISRNVQGILGNQVSLDEESFEGFLLEAPAFARPPEYEGITSPSEYMNGNHAKISALKTALSECKTKYFRPNELLKHKRRKKYEK